MPESIAHLQTPARQRAAETRSAQTRARLLQAGLQLFSALGVDGVRTRQLVDIAGCSQSAIPYHFGGKRELYAAVLERGAQAIADRLPLPATPPNDVQQAARQLQQLMRAFVIALLSVPDAGPRTLLLAREQIQPTAAFGTAHRVLFEPLHDALARCVACLRGADAGSASVETLLRTHALLGQAIVFAVSHGALRARLGEDAAAADAETIAAVVSGMALAAAAAAPA